MDRATYPAAYPLTGAAAAPSFTKALRARVVEAQTALGAAEVLDEPFVAQIAAADLADLESLAVRNDVDLEG